MMAHWQHSHKTKTMPAELSEQLKISEKEKSGLVKFAKSSGSGAAKRKNAYDAAATPAAIASAARRL
jgi:hypothetical protein